MSNTLPTDETFHNLFFRHVFGDSDALRSGAFKKVLFRMTHFKFESDVSASNVITLCSRVHLLYKENLKVLHDDGHTLDATLLSLGRRAWDAPNTGAVECEDGEDE